MVSLTLWLLWLWWPAPFFFTPDESVEYQQPSYQLFAYGTLRNRFVRKLVTGGDVKVTVDELAGFEREGLNIVANEAAVTVGVRMQVSKRQMQRLDRYERLGLRYCRFQVFLTSGEQAWVYQRLNGEGCEQQQQ
ncbi:Gamma-glutamyl cyclotransferase, AIG2-like [Alkalimonas amylolytica]|uniref:Gamma-glutamyl cyclotransferase, AIG2-like n=2 Tax=Alkalimonas amylolytica TaxID=152573 RepID=A0A1H4C9J7_ALKAM|nr:gamma-glutamylcyclotransferase family protein [Alkalimonas amylolytica]SEA57000.1 Gamma-glutamyl cyclotransferase, AIG2-like [Alkalimonas amylolytica]